MEPQNWLAKVIIRSKPQFDTLGWGKSAELRAEGFTEVENVLFGKIIEIKLSGLTHDVVEERVRSMCEELLANHVTEEFDFTLELL